MVGICLIPILVILVFGEDILLATDTFLKYLRFWMGTDDRIGFWLDTSLGGTPLASQFPGLLQCAQGSKAKVICYMEKVGNTVALGPTFRSNLTEREENQLMALLNLLDRICIPKATFDGRVWSGSKDGDFSAVLFYRSITGLCASPNPIFSICSFKSTNFSITEINYRFRRAF